MAEYKKKPKKIKHKLLDKYKLVVLNENTFEERLSIKLTRLNVFVLVSLSAIFLIAITYGIIAFTPLREYIPGYSSTALKKKATELNYKTDSLTRVISINDKYYTSIKNVLKGDVSAASLPKKPRIKSPIKLELFPPVKGAISEAYNAKEKHYAVDIVVAENTPVKATADGIVIFSEWTSTTGNVIIIEHDNCLLSAYKHNTTLTKSQGDLVKAGDIIATAGNTGDLSTGPHLHFELWNDGHPINPTNFIDFK